MSEMLGNNLDGMVAEIEYRRSQLLGRRGGLTVGSAERRPRRFARRH